MSLYFSVYSARAVALDEAMKVFGLAPGMTLQKDRTCRRSSTVW